MTDPIDTTPATVDPPKIAVNTSALPGGATLALRQIVIAVGGWAAARGYVAGDTLQMLVAIIPTIGAVLWGQVRRYLEHRVLSEVAASPDNPGVAFRGATPIPPTSAG